VQQADHPSAILVDPHPLWLDAVEHVVAGVPVRIAAKTASLEEAQGLIEQLEPDLVVAEIAVGSDKADGLGWLRRTVERFQTNVIVLTTCADPEYISAALECGASGYVLKTAHPDDLAATVRQTFHHSIYLPPGQAHPTARPLLESHDLTRRELEILSLAAEGYSNAKLAKMLWVTEQTVKFHLSNVYRKLNVSNRTEASRWAQLHGLPPPDSVPTKVA
jgi:DNA-binding NarL/FixJ family response regulator